ncbi:MAG: type II secretion system protein [Sedimentisphaeraceae bacterium JB056]
MFKPKVRYIRAFTLIELLVVISVITLLMAVFGISANKVNQVARNLKQKAQMHSMEVGLELYLKDFGDYPDSDPVNAAGSYVYGPQHLTEALFGRDLAGFEVNSKFHGTGDGTLNGAAITDYYKPYSDISQNRRKGPYMQIKEGGVDVIYMNYGTTPLYSTAELTAGSIYHDSSLAFDPSDLDSQYNTAAPVIVDVFRQKKIERPSGENTYVGTPVLYFKANRGSKLFSSDGPGSGATYSSLKEWTYNYFDNSGFYELPNLKNPTDPDTTHRFSPGYTDPVTGLTGIEAFYDYITNDKVSSFDQAQNPEGFLLISAGRDGIYGTKDDVTNFER